MEKKTKAIEFVGKGLIVHHEGRRIAVLSDLHLGYGESLRRSGYMVPSSSFREGFDDIKQFLEWTGKVDSVVILGDVKHYFGMILREEREETFTLLDYFRKYSDEIVIIKGNHDAIIAPMLEGTGVLLGDYHIVGPYAFLHGDRDFKEIYDKEIKYWIVGHVHPAVELSDGTKRERYKCFLRGPYKGKEIIVIPSLFSKSEGIDVLTQDLGLVWPLDAEKCSVLVVGEGKEPLDFGIARKIRGR